MLRFWQAYISLVNTQDLRPAQRILSVSRPVTQIRLSALVVTLAIFLTVLLSTVLCRFNERRDPRAKQLHVPGSPLGWAVTAASLALSREAKMPAVSPATFISQNPNLALIIGRTDDGQFAARIVSPIK